MYQMQQLGRRTKLYVPRATISFSTVTGGAKPSEESAQGSASIMLWPCLVDLIARSSVSFFPTWSFFRVSSSKLMYSCEKSRHPSHSFINRGITSSKLLRSSFKPNLNSSSLAWSNNSLSLINDSLFLWHSPESWLCSFFKGSYCSRPSGA